MSVAWHVVYSDAGDEVVSQCSGLMEPGHSLAVIGSRGHIVHPLMGPLPFILGVASLPVPGTKPLAKGETLLADVAFDVAAKALPDVVVEGLKHLLHRERLVGPGES